MTNKKPDFVYLQYCRTEDEVKDAYRKLAVQFHPDKGGNDANMQQLNEEYQYIKDEKPPLPIKTAAQVTGRDGFTDYSAKRKSPPKQAPRRETRRKSKPFYRTYEQETADLFETIHRATHQNVVFVMDPAMFMVLITKYRAVQLENKHNKGWVWNQMINFLKERNLKIQAWHLLQYAVQMGHSSQWAMKAVAELNRQGVYVI